MSTPSLVKQPAESRLFSMDFSPLLAAGETITSVTSVTVSPDDHASVGGLQLSGSAAATGAFAYQRITGGITGTKYKVTFVAATSMGNILESEGDLQVKDL